MWENMERSSRDKTEGLRAPTHELEAQLQKAELDTKGRTRARSPRAHPGGWMLTSAVLLVLACLLAPVSVIAVWANTQLLDTDRYVQTMAPLAEDPVIQEAVAAKATSTVLQSVDIGTVSQELLKSLTNRRNTPPRLSDALRALAEPMTNGVDNFVRTQVEAILAGDEFPRVWAVMNRAAHEQVLRLLADDRRGAVKTQDNTITLNLAPIIALVKQELVKDGFTLADKIQIPHVERSFVLVQSDAVPTAQRAYRVLNTLGPWLPFVVLGLFSVGVLAATDRRRALLRGALGVVAGMLLVGVGLPIFRATYVESSPTDILPPTAAGHVFDALVLSLRTGVLAAAVFGLVVAVICYFSGPSQAARRTRSILVRNLDTRGSS